MMGGYPSQPTPDQIQALSQAPITPGINPSQQSMPITPWQAATSGSVSGLPSDNIWDKLMATVGQGKPSTMPGTTVGAPAGASPAAAPPPAPMLPQGQMAPPRGIPNLAALLNPTAGAGTGNLMGQYLALQQLMRGA